METYAPRLLIEYNQLQVEIIVSCAQLLAGKALARAFVKHPLDGVTTEIALFARFIQFTSTRDAGIALAAFNHFNKVFCAGTDIHVVVAEQGLDFIQTQGVLRDYFSVAEILAARNEPLPTVPTALFAATGIKRIAQFGGQAGSKNYIEEARWLLDIYRPLIGDFVSRVAEFLKREAQDPNVASAYPQGLDLLRWLTEPESTPSSKYLLTAAISLPIVGFVQLLHVLVLFKTLQVSPGELSALFDGTIGHSQGLVVAAAVASATDEESFYAVSEKALGILLTLGSITQLDYPVPAINPELIKDAIANEGIPSPMVSVQGLKKATLEKFISEHNSHQSSPSSHVQLSLINTVDRFVVVGETPSVINFVRSVRSKIVSPTTDQSGTIFSQRKPAGRLSYIVSSAPFHFEHNQQSPVRQYALIAQKGWVLNAADLTVPVHASTDGHDLRSEQNLTKYLVDTIAFEHIDWPAATAKTGATHFVDFSPESLASFGSISHRNQEGRGVSVIAASSLVPDLNGRLGSKADLYKTKFSEIVSTPNWLKQFGPKLVRTAFDGQLHVDSAMRRVLGKPTIMVPGMTPTTTNEKLVAAINEAGYYSEFGSGNVYSENTFVRKIDTLVSLLPAGHGITLNCVYVNPALWDYQYPLLLKLRKEGYPITGLCVSGGTPAVEAGIKIISELRDAGFHHITFKPGTAGYIRDVVAMAKAHSDFPVILQWTGGRAGGHHSNEDFHEPILETYAAVRSQSNIVLIAGSGFGGVDDTLPYTTGDWSVKFGRAPMPFDGILVGSRIMVAKECAAADSIKELIVATPGVDDSEWEKTFDGPAGGIVTGKGEFGELIHFVANRAALVTCELHNRIFSLPKDKQAEALQANKAYIIEGLNNDSMKPWFATKPDGTITDIEELTYIEVAKRLVELLYVKHQSRWIDPSYAAVVADFLQRIEDRFATSEVNYIVQAAGELSQPNETVESIAQAYPAAQTQLLTSEDVKFFLALCRRPGQKPVAFVPVIDEEFPAWLTKDATWQAEDLEAAPGQDPQRVFIQQGPVSVKYSTKVNEPVKEILDNIYYGHVAHILQRYYGGDESKVPVVEYIGTSAKRATGALPETVSVKVSSSERVYVLGSDRESLPSTEQWVSELAGPTTSWLSALLTTPVVVQEKQYTANLVREMFRPRAGRTVTVSLAAGSVPSKVTFAAADGTVELEASKSADNVITVTVFHPYASKRCTISFAFTYRPEMGFAPIHEVAGVRDDQISKAFQEMVSEWLRAPLEPIADISKPTDAETSRKFTITQDHVDRFCSIASNDIKEYKPSGGQAASAPIDFLFFAAWPEILRFMLAREAYGGLLNLLHLTNDFKLEESASKLKVGDTVQTAIRADEVVNTDLGKVMKLRATLFVDGVLVATIVSEFLARNTTIASDLAFKNVETQGVRVSLRSLEDVAVLEAKEWFAYTGDRKLAAGDLVEFSVTSGYRYKAADVFSSVKTSGTVHMVLESGEKVLVGEVDYVGGESFGDPVVEYINSNETAAADASEFQFAHDGLPILSSEPNGKIITVAPADNWTYSHVSGDYNPIHTNGYLADYALLPATITHGMWTSASTRAVVEKYAAGGQPERMRRYAVSFVGMVYPGDRLETTLRHIGFHNGLMVVKGETVSQRGTKVLECTAEIAQPQTAFVFTGQGSQFAGMGMDLYESSAAARSVWDRADTHMRARYGVSLLEIVRKNPTELTVKFGGKRGADVRRTYQSLVVNAAKADDADRALFPAITDSSFSYTHRSASGLLNATLFTQPAQTVLSLAYIADLRAKSIVPTRAAFAGHSLGEFGALAATSQLVSVEDAVDIALYRGLLLYSSVARDAHGQSKYAMVAVNPSRVGGGFDEAALELVVGTLREAGGHLLEVINYNVQGMQYIATGHLSQLNALRLAVDAIAAAKVSATTDEGRTAIVQIAKDVLAKADDSALQNSEATTVIAGVDVPSHSSQLAGSVDTFRRVLQSKIHASTVDYARLHKQYIPNVTAKPFEVSRRYFELTRNVTGSPILELELGLWDNSALENQAGLQRLAHVLVIELLAYQFASPVRWIETQSALLEEVQAARIVEVGPSATLGDMMRRTLRVIGNHSFDGAILHIGQQAADVLYAYDPESITPAVVDEDEDEVKTEKQQPAPAPVAAPEPVPAPVPVAPVAPVVQAAPSSGPVSDVPIQALDIIQSLIAAKVKKSVGDISPSSCIKDFSGGKSTLQNEIVGDLQKEFGSGIPDKAEDLALSALAGAIGSFGGVLGKHSSALVAKLFGSKMPGGFSQSKVRALLESSYGLGPQRQNALLLHALTLEPSSRLGSESEATAWLDTAAKSYAAHAGISLGSGAAAAQPAVAVQQFVAAPVAQVAASSGPVAEAPLQALEVIQALIAAKVKKSVAEIATSQCIKDYSGGKSTLQNEIIGDLQKEFGSSVPDKAEDLALSALASSIGAFGGALGKHTSALVAKLFSSKLPGGFAQARVRSLLESSYGLGPQRQNAFLVHALTMEPASRLGSESEATAWLDSVAQAYAAKAGIQLGSAGGATPVAVNATVAVSGPVSDQSHRDFVIQQINVMARYAGIDLRAGDRLADDARAVAKENQAKLDAISEELGDDLVEGVQGKFEPRKARKFDSAWNWARQDAVAWIYGVLLGDQPEEDAQRLLALTNRSSSGLLKLVAATASVLQRNSGDAASVRAAAFAQSLYKAIEAKLGADPVYKELAPSVRPHVDISATGEIKYSEVPREGEPTIVDYVERMRQEVDKKDPFVFLQKHDRISKWSLDHANTSVYFDVLAEVGRSGLSFAGKTALVTGCGRGSIGADILQGLLSGGAKVIATTSSYNRRSLLFFEDMYRRFGARGSELVVVPYNQGSLQDVKALVAYIYDAQGLGWDLDYVVPFAAISEIGKDITCIDSKSELALRIMLTNTLRLLGEIKLAKVASGYTTSPVLAIVPLSPNKGVFGGDGLYSECKAGLETLFNRWNIESWADYVSITGAVIGWTRGTNMMDGNDMNSYVAEKTGIRSFSTKEMAFNILGLMTPTMTGLADQSPVWADFNGGFQLFFEAGHTLVTVRASLVDETASRKAIAAAALHDHTVVHRRSVEKVVKKHKTQPLAKHGFEYPKIKAYEQLAHLRKLEGMVNLDKVVVATGYGEVGSYGNAETRWEMEAFGEFSIEGSIELAWIMGLIKHFNGVLQSTGEHYTGWVDAKTEEPVKDKDVKSKYEEQILEHTGIRLIEPELHLGYDPNKKPMLHEVQIEHDMPPFEASAEEAANFKNGNEDKVEIWENEDGTWSVKFNKGAVILVPKALRFDRLVTAQLPSGWDPKRYGFPQNIIDQVDPTTLHSMVATVEALLRSGVTDPYELYKYMHLSEIGNTIGSSLGGAHAASSIFIDRFTGKDMNSDILQETMINVVAGWTNMLLLSSAGPIQPVVAACATSLVAIDVAVETIQTGKAKIMFAGGYDDFSPEASYEFAQLGATNNTIEDLADGRTPKEMSRPCTTTRHGFIEAQGAAVVMLMSASAAIEIGAPIYGIIAMSGTATDKQGRSIPAPGQGLLTAASERPTAFPSPLLDIDYRREQLTESLTAIDAWATRQAAHTEREATWRKAQDSKFDDALFVKERTAFIASETRRQKNGARNTWGNEFWKRDQSIAPIRGALATWNLTVDDIGVSSFHGTSTKANDKNESEVVDKQLRQLGRTPGHAVPAVCQKWLTGHHKGGAGGVMLNGVLQILRTGIVPGNRNADNIDSEFEKFDHLYYPAQSIHTSGIKAGTVTSFGFAQASGELVVVHPDHLYAVLGKDDLEAYTSKVADREKKTYRYWHDSLIGNKPFVRVKDAAPYTEEQEKQVYMDAGARVQYDAVTDSYHY